jgi:hypothetical protein
MFRLSQLQIQYILRSQNELLKKLTLERENYRKVRKENGKIKRSLSDRRDTSRELFKVSLFRNDFTNNLYKKLATRHQLSIGLS